MAALPPEDSLNEELRHDRAQRALKVAVVTGFIKDFKSVQASCLGLCNVWRGGVPVRTLRVGPRMPPTLLAMIVSDVSTGVDRNKAATRVLEPRRVLRLELSFVNNVPGEWGLYRRVPGHEHGPNPNELDLTRVRWPDGVKDVQLFAFNKKLEGVVWPPGLERLSFHLHNAEKMRYLEVEYAGTFNRPLHGANFPSGLREIFLGSAFDQDIAEVVWPELLERLSLPGFNKPIDNVQWPPRLLALEFQTPAQILLRKKELVTRHDVELNMGGFNHPLTNLPASLETLWLSDGFDRRLEGVSWPGGLKTLGIGAPIVGDVSLPSTLKQMYSTHYFVGPFPPDCEVTVVKEYDSDCFMGDDSKNYMAEARFCASGFDGPGEDEYCDDDCPFTGWGTEYDNFL